MYRWEVFKQHEISSIYFRGLSSRWTSLWAAWVIHWRESWPPEASAPMVHATGEQQRNAKFFSFSKNRTYSIPLPLPYFCRRVCVGSSHGWLITVNNMSEMHHLNHVTGVQAQLPSITEDRLCHHLLCKAILSSSPSRIGRDDFIESHLNTQACMQACLCSLNQTTLPNYTYYLATQRINSVTLMKVTCRMGDGCWWVLAPI